MIKDRGNLINNINVSCVNISYEELNNKLAKYSYIFCCFSYTSPLQKINNFKINININMLLY